MVRVCDENTKAKDFITQSSGYPYAKAENNILSNTIGQKKFPMCTLPLKVTERHILMEQEIKSRSLRIEKF